MSEEDKDKTEESSGGKGWLNDIIREVTLTGLATFFMTEDKIRDYLKERKFPKELVGLFLEGVTKKKDDFYGLLAKEFGRVLQKIDLTREVSKFLETHTVHFDAKISFERKRKDESDSDG